VPRWLHIPDEVAELAGARVLLGEDGEDVLGLGLARYVLGQCGKKAKGRIRISDLVRAGDNLGGRLSPCARRESRYDQEHQCAKCVCSRHGGARPQSEAWLRGSPVTMPPRRRSASKQSTSRPSARFAPTGRP